MARYDFNEKVAVVTGGGSGIGAACAKTLAAGGATVIVADHAAEQGQRVTAEITSAGGEALFLPVDVSKADEVERMVAQTVEKYGRLDLAVNNAGVGGEPSPTGAYTVEGWRRVIGINLDGVFYCMRYEIPRMLAGGGGAIVNMASILGTVGFRTAPAYVAAKHGVVGLTKAAALEYADRGIRINSVGPAFINTPLLSTLDEPMLNQVRSLHPIGRLGEAQEVANLVAFLCSDDASYLTGGYYLVDGAYTAQ
jgi:NAD(P)-dependent dehydrogenase (short-subunit alcohol dehydrogenase family)